MNISNGMNCQNCHLEAGTKPFGNNYGSVASTYPKFRARSGQLESIEKRVNDCLERSLNGSPLDSLSEEMRSIVAYIQWLGKDVPKGQKAAGSGLVEMKWLDRPADPVAGEKTLHAKMPDLSRLFRRRPAPYCQKQLYLSAIVGRKQL